MDKTIIGIFGIIIFLILGIIISNNSKKTITCPKEVLGTRIRGIKLARYLGFPTINISSNISIPCGFYKGNTDFGKATMAVGKYNNLRADLHFDNFNKDIDNLVYIKIWDLVRIENSESDIISTYNNGCNC